ncbi:universal stress protein [Streptomyces chartreusis]|uniref:universal stress protein n=1 Tax=Streptomyces TaxID=1883 RepID=UPI002F919453|nr:universal stress protein [Streptomyces chartreusis]
MERVIITGVDRSAHSRAAADWAAREALLRGLPLRVVHVSPPDGAGADGESGRVAPELRWLSMWQRTVPKVRWRSVWPPS